jgi:hypothetical protein
MALYCALKQISYKMGLKTAKKEANDLSPVFAQDSLCGDNLDVETGQPV